MKEALLSRVEVAGAPNDKGTATCKTILCSSGANQVLNLKMYHPKNFDLFQSNFRKILDFFRQKFPNDLFLIILLQNFRLSIQI